MSAAALATHAETCTQCAGAFDGVEYAAPPTGTLCAVGSAALSGTNGRSRVLPTLASIGERMRTQDNRCTALPVFLVQKKRRTYGFDPDYTDAPVWVHQEGGEAEGEELARLEEQYDLGNDTPDEWTRTGYVDSWEYVMPFFTEAAAQTFIDENSHRLGEARIYVESGYRNPEWEAIRSHLMALTAVGS